jgi:hypothetical protein
MPKKQTKGAGLDEFGKIALRAAIIRDYPDLATFEEELDFLIEQYNKDKTYLKKLTENTRPMEKVLEEDMAKEAVLRTIKPGDPEYERIMNACAEEKRKHEEAITKGYEEEQQKLKSKESNI